MKYRIKNILFALIAIVAFAEPVATQNVNCPTPYMMSVSDLTDSGAVLHWYLPSATGIPSHYIFVLKDVQGNILRTDSAATAPGMSYSITGLSANTTYSVELQADCNRTGDGISDMASFTFTTACTAQMAPYSQDFDSGMPNCIYSSHAGISAGGRSGNCLTLTNRVDSTAYIVFPRLTLSSNNIEVGVWLKGSSITGGGTPINIGIITDPSDIETSFEPLYTSTLTSTTWTEIRMNTSSTQQPVTQTTMICIALPQGLLRTLYIDDVVIHSIPTCVRPENFSISNIAARTAEFSWTTTNATNCRIYIHSANDNRAVTATSNPYTITTLQPNTNYTFQIRGICSAADSSELSPAILTAHTECVAADSALFSESFESVTTANTLPDCWAMGWWNKPLANTKAAPFTSSTIRSHSGQTSMSLVKQTAGSVAYLTTQQLPIDQANQYTLSVWVYRQNASYFPNEGLKFWVGPTPDDTTGATLLGFVPRHYQSAPVESSANNWYNYEFVIPISGNLYVMVEGLSFDGDAVYFDDLRVRRTPTCFKVSNVGLGTPASNSVPLTWNRGQNEQQWIVSYTVNGITYITDTVNTNSYTIRNLASATTYNIEGTVTAMCGVTDFSEPVQFSQTITTTCQPLTYLPYSCGFEQSELTDATNPMPMCWQRYNDSQTSDNYYPFATTSTTYAHTGEGYLKFMPVSSTLSDYGAHQVAVLPEINTTLYPINTLRIVFYASVSAPVAEELVVGVMTDPTRLSTFVPVDSYLVATTNYLKVEKRFANYTGNGRYVALMCRRINNTYLSVNIDDVRLETVPTCPDLDGDGVTVSDIASQSVRLTETDFTATKWSFAYGLAGTPLSACTIVDTTGSSIILGNLQAQTDYVVYARRHCTNDYGAWGSAVTFRTACGAATVPFSDDFESYSDGGLVGCYSVTSSDTHSLNVFTEASGAAGDISYNHSSGGSKGLCSSFGESSTSRVASSDEFTFTNLIHLEAGRNYELSAYAKKSTTNGAYAWNLAFLTGSSTTSLTVFSTSAVNSSDWTKYNAFFTATATGDYYVGFRTSPATTGGNYYPFIDDIMLREVQCIPPTSSFVSTLTSNSATVSFASTATQWEVAVSNTPIDIEGTVAGNVYCDTINTTSFTVSGLAVNSDYYYTIRSLCGAGVASDWMRTGSFRTRCTAKTVPYIEDFENASSTTCWSTINGDGVLSRSTTIRHTGTSSMQIDGTSAVSPEINVNTFIPYTLTGWAYSATDSAVLQIGVMTDPDDASTFISLTTVTVTPANTWVELATLFTSLSDTALADFRNSRYLVLSAGTNTIYIDDLNLDVTPSCARPTNGSTTAITGHTVTLDWTENNNATSWLVRAVPTAGTPVVQRATSHPYTLTNLNAATRYTLYVSSICSPTDTSSEYQIGVVQTACDYINAPYYENFEYQALDVAPTCWSIASSTTSSAQSHPERVWAVYQNDGNKSIRMYNGMTQSGDAIIETPEIILPAGSNCELRYDWCHHATSGDLIVGIRRHGATAYTTIDTHQQQNGLTDYTTPAFTTSNIGLQTYAGDTVQIRFYNLANWGQGAIWVDNVKVRVLTSCTEIRTATVQSVSTATATIAFADTCAAHTAWQYVVGEKGFDEDYATPVNVSSKMFTINGLTQATDYDLYIRAACQDGEYSSWVQVSFKTDAEPAALPYFCDFADNAQNSQWLSLGTSANSFIFGNNGQATFGNGTHAMYVSNGGNYGYNNATTTVAGMARLVSFAEKSYVIEFDYKCSGGESNADFGRFYLAPASSSLLPSGSGIFSGYTWPSGIIPLDDSLPISDVDGSRHVSEIVDMNGRSGDYYLVYVWCNDGNSGSQYPLSVGNVKMYELNCLPVEDLTVSDITTTSASVGCFNPNVGASLQWAVSTSELIFDTVLTGTSSADNFVISRLSPSTEYHLFVRSSCENGYQSPWTAVELTTLCDAVSQYPYSEDFETSSFPPVCWTATTLTSVETSYGTVNGEWVQSTRNCNGSKGAAFSGNDGTSALLSSPLFTLNPDREYHVSYWIMRSGSSWNTDQVKVYIGQKADSKTGATMIASYVVYDPTKSGNGLVKYDIDLPSGLSGDYRILFEAIDITNGYIYLDDVEMNEYPPCRNLTNLPAIAATTSTEVTLAMRKGVRSAIEYGLAAGYPAQATAITQTALSADGNATFTGLTPAASYSVFARGICQDNDSTAADTTAWTVAVRVTTKADDCFTPENLRISGIVSDTSATIVWNRVPDVTSYQCILSDGTQTDTTSVATATFSRTNLAPNTAYTLTVRGFCGTTDTTGWATYSFATLTVPAVIPYNTGFESTDDNSSWQRLNSGYVNNFIFGTDGAAHKTGRRGLYISNNGQSYGQSVPTNSTVRYGVDIYGVAYVRRTIHFPSAGSYAVSYDWKCDPLNSSTATYKAYGRAFLAPAQTSLPVDSNAYERNLPDGAIALGENLESNPSWQHCYTIFTIDTARYMDIVFMWLGDNVNGYTPQTDASSTPLAVDNVAVTAVTCNPVSAIAASNITDTSAIAVVSKADAVDLQYAVTTSADESTINAYIALHSVSYRDTLILSGLNPNTTYYLYVRQLCGAADSSFWRAASFTTTTVPATAPYICGFEDSSDRANWLFTDDKENRLCIGTATSFGGTHALYVTNDGHTYTYSDSLYAYAYASRLITLRAGMYDYSFDWQCLGEAGNDGARVFIIPSSVKLRAGSWLHSLSNTTVPSNAIAMDGGSLLYNRTAYTPMSGTFTLADSDLYNIVVAWRNDTYIVHNPAFAMDNLRITEVTCLPPSVSVASGSIGEDSAAAVITNPNEGSTIVYALSATGEVSDAASVDTLYYTSGVDTIRFSGLSASTAYTLFVRSICSVNDSSYWTTSSFKTQCGTVTAFPYTENFESLQSSSSFVQSAAAEICWTAINAVKATPYYTISNTQHYEGSKSIQLTSSSTTPLVMVLPAMSDINNTVLTFASKYSSTTANKGTLTAGYVTDINNADSFVALLTPTRSKSWFTNTLIFTGVPAGARVAFRFGDAVSSNNTAYIDKVRVSQLANGPLFYDTVCYNKSYTKNGFSIPIATIQYGDNVFTRIKTSSTEGAKDTLYTAYVYKLQNISSTTYDTICEGQPYNKGLWTLTNPTTRRYQYTFAGASACGCDSTVELYLTVVPTRNVIYDTICWGGSYQFGDTILTTPGIYTKTHIGQNGCTCFDTLHLSQLPDTVFDVATVCQNDLPYIWHRQSIITAGRHLLTITGQHQCQQTAVLDLAIIPTDSTYTVHICQGGSAVIADTVVTTAGQYVIIRQNASGCLMTHHVTVVVDAPRIGDVYDIACQGYPYIGYGISGLIITSDTIVTVSTRTIDAQCDSIGRVHLTFVATVHYEYSVTIQKGESYNFDGTDLTQPGDYNATFRSAVTNCDSTVTLHLSVTTDVALIEDINLNIVPNPVNAGQTAFIYGDFSADNIASVEIVNEMGKTIEHLEPTTYPIEIKGLSAFGLYYVRLTTRDGRVAVKKLIVK